MKYRLKKDLPWAKAGTIVESDKGKSAHNVIISYSCTAKWGRDAGKKVWHAWYPYMYESWSDWFEEVDERWKPEKDCIYYTVGKDGALSYDRWDNYPLNEERYNFGNCFRTRELAERAAEEIKALLKEFHKNNP